MFNVWFYFISIIMKKSLVKECLFAFLVFLLLMLVNPVSSIDFKELPPEHLPYYFNLFPSEKKKCEQNDDCIYQGYLNKDVCWGYETNCNKSNRYSKMHCPGDHRGWVRTKESQEDTFYYQGDFGYIKEQKDQMMVMCEPYIWDDSSLECSKYFRYCRGRNIMMNFTELSKDSNNIRYSMDILKYGQIGGYCHFHETRHKSELEHLSPLQSWGPEMKNFVTLPERPVNANYCTVVVEKPTYIMKLDATVNMYHHFCDFFNLYASLHVNSISPLSFSRDNHILVWETYTYDSAFKETWKAFTDNPIWDLKTFRGEVVCFQNAIFPLLPRMIFGLFYNTPIIYGCENSGLFHAFSKHVLHALSIKLHRKIDKKVTVTLLSRDTKYRRILNEDKLLEALGKVDGYRVNRVVYKRDVPFRTQLELTHNSDVFIGMHGAGLTHAMFLPDWGAVFELYNCEDPSCYSDLARLRGLKYVTWENKTKLFQQDEGNHPDGGSHAKFTNYAFDVEEFLRLVMKAAQHVRNHPDFQKFIKESEVKEEL